MSQVIEIRVPDLGSNGPLGVIELLVGSGDLIEVDTPLITLESDKATMDVPSTVRGRVEELLAQKGARLATGDLIARVRVSGDAQSPPTAAPPTEPIATSQPAAPDFRPDLGASRPVPEAPAAALAPAIGLPRVAQSPHRGDGGYVRAGPAVRRLARELGVDLAVPKGSGPRGRLTPGDVKAYVKARTASHAGRVGPHIAVMAALPALPKVDFATFGPIETHPLSRIQRISGPRLHASWVNLPHVTQFDEADITDLEALRLNLKPKAEAAGIKLTLLAFFLRACVQTLERFPKFNSSLAADGQSLVFKQYMHVGFAVDTPNGLVVPVLRDANRLDVFRIARQLAELSQKARTGKLQGTDMQGGSFTISSLGGIGGAGFTPIIKAPEVAILGVSRAANKPVWQRDAFVPRLVAPLALSYDHRVIDGAEGARFTTALREALFDVRALLEAVP